MIFRDGEPVSPTRLGRCEQGHCVLSAPSPIASSIEKSAGTTQLAEKEKQISPTITNGDGKKKKKKKKETMECRSVGHMHNTSVESEGGGLAGPSRYCRSRRPMPGGFFTGSEALRAASSRSGLPGGTARHAADCRALDTAV